MQKIRLWYPALAAGWLANGRVAAACPDCVPIREARAAIEADPNFWTYVLITGLPFIIVTFVALLAYRLSPPPPRKAPAP